MIKKQQKTREIGEKEGLEKNIKVFLLIFIFSNFYNSP